MVGREDEALAYLEALRRMLEARRRLLEAWLRYLLDR